MSLKQCVCVQTTQSFGSILWFVDFTSILLEFKEFQPFTHFWNCSSANVSCLLISARGEVFFLSSYFSFDILCVCTMRLSKIFYLFHFFQNINQLWTQHVWHAIGECSTLCAGKKYESPHYECWWQKWSKTCHNKQTQDEDFNDTYP